MVDETYKRYRADDRSYFSMLKRDIRQSAEAAAMDKHRLANLDLILSEMTSNLHKYGKAGELLAGIFSAPSGSFFEILCLDHGSGMADTEEMITDGYSSSSTMGIGLGSIKRLSDYFEIYSQKGWGTVVLSRLQLPERKPTRQIPVVVKPLVLKMPGEEVSGDGTYFKYDEEHLYLLVADGLGHGPLAQYAVNEAVQAFNACTYQLPSDIIRYLHDAIRKTRGIVATIVVYDFNTKVWTIAGIGNITAKFSNNMETKNVMSYNGIIGLTIPNTINNQKISSTDFPQITLCSDGIKSKWELNKLPGIGRYDLSIQAAAVYKDYARQTDDMSVVIAKIV